MTRKIRLLCFVTFPSVVIPLTAIALNLLSVGAACGVQVLIFQQGHVGVWWVASGARGSNVHGSARPSWCGGGREVCGDWRQACGGSFSRWGRRFSCWG